MNATTPPVAPSSSPTPLEQFRVALLLHLPELALRIIPTDNPAGQPSTEYPNLDLYDEVTPDKNYDPAALAAWVLQQVEALAAAASLRAATFAADELEQESAEVIQLAGASSTFVAMAEWHSYLTKLAPILRRNMAIAEQWDLARTLEAEAARVQGVLLALVDRFPQLQVVLSDEVGRRAQGLVDPAGNDLSN